MAKLIRTLPAGFECGPYTIVREAGRGGMAIVYLATGPGKRQYAIKTMQFNRSLQPGQVRRFHREIHVVASITHNNVVRFYDAGRIVGGDTGSVMWMAQEFVDGATLREQVHLSGGRVEVDDVANWSEQIAGGVSAAHEVGVVHRDLKPENVMLAGVGGSKIIKVIDFNISKFRQWGTTTTGHKREALGTVGYMAPEQLDGNAADIDERADVYALGLIIFELATGQHALAPDGQQLSMEETIARTCAYEPPRLDLQIAGFPANLADIAERALQKKPDDRFQTMGAMRDALKECKSQYLLARRRAVLQATDWGIPAPQKTDASGWAPGQKSTVKLATPDVALQHAARGKESRPTVTTLTSTDILLAEREEPVEHRAPSSKPPPALAVEYASSSRPMASQVVTTRSGGRLALALNHAIHEHLQRNWALRGAGVVVGGVSGYLVSGVVLALLSPLWASAHVEPRPAAARPLNAPSASARTAAPSLASLSPSTTGHLEPEASSASEEPVPAPTLSAASPKAVTQPRWPRRQRPTPPTPKPSRPSIPLFPDE